MRTGIFEYLRKCIASITGKDPENEGSSALYRFYSQTTSGTMGLPASGTVPFKHSVITPVQTPPGVYYDTNGKVTKPHIYDATMGDAIRVLPFGAAGYNVTNAAYIGRFSECSPEATVGAAQYNALVAEPDEWKWGRVAITAGAGGATNDTELVATVAGKKIQISILGITALALVDAAANTSPVITLQDSDNVQLGGAAVIGLGVTYCNVVAAALSTNVPCRQWDLMRGPVAYSATANKAIEADLAGCTQNDVIEVIYAWREFA